jgi:hypothetical protein
MVRLVLLGLLLVGLGMGLQKGWLRVDWERIRQDLPFPKAGQQG